MTSEPAVAARASAQTPAVLGGGRTFPDGLPLVRAGLGDADTARVLADIEGCLRSGMLTSGQLVQQLEDAVAERLGVAHVVAVANCTLGLVLALRACGIGGGRVASPSFTFSATAHAVAWAGATPLFCDVRADDFTLDAADTAARGPAEGIIATHIYGTPCRVDALEKLASDWGVPLVFDAAHALGATFDGRPVGGFGRAEVFSLTPTKVITSAEGGLIATSDSDVAEYCRVGRDYANPGDYDCRFVGINARMSELHAAVGLATFADLDRRLGRRHTLAASLHARLRELPGITFPAVDPADSATFKDFTVVIDPDGFGMDAATLQVALAAEGVASRRYYHPPVHRQQAYADVETAPLEVTDDISPRVLALPFWADMADSDAVRLASLMCSMHESADAVAAAVATAGRGGP